MDPKEVFERRAKRGVGSMAPGPAAAGALDSVTDAIFERAPMPVFDPLPRMLEFQRKAESWFSFPYHCLMNVEYRPHDQLVLTFSTHEVLVLGRNLKALYEDILNQRRGSIVEMDRATALAVADDGFEVRRIAIEEISQRGHGKRGAAPKPPAP